MQISNYLASGFLLLVLSTAAGFAADAVNVKMVGSIDNRYAISMNYTQKGDQLTGSYKYATSKTSLKLKGNIDAAGVAALIESDEKGITTGTFSGKFAGGKRFVGTWTDAKKTKTLPCLMALEGDRNALESGKDGVVLTQVVKKIPKPKTQYSEADVATVTYPVVNLSLLPATVGALLEKSISTQSVLKESPEKMAADIKGGEMWLHEVDYVVNYNKNYLLDIDFNRDGAGAYPSGSTYHVLANLRNGKTIRAVDAFESAAIPKLETALAARMNQEVKNTFKEYANSPEELGAVKEQLSGPVKVSQELLNNFTVSDKGVTFSQDWGFPHVSQALQPDGKYLFTYEQLKPFVRLSGPLGQFISPVKK